MVSILLVVGIGDRPAFFANIVQNADPPTDPVTLLINYGPLGIFLILLATGQFRTKFELQRLEKQLAEEKAENLRLRQEVAGKDELVRGILNQVSGHALPALAQSARVFEAIPTADTDHLRQVESTLTALAKEVEKLSRGESQ